MRLFTAIDLPPAVITNLEHLLDHLRPAARIHWTQPANLHITTRFIGEWPDARLAELQTALDSLRSRPPIDIAVRRLGFFPNERSPRVFWAGVEASTELPALASAIDRALASLGLPPEGRPYSPHLTLARIKEPVPLAKLREKIAALPSLDFGAFTAARFHLYQSRLTRDGSVYTKLTEYPFIK
jgi:2'-5' RNA ligase